MTTLIHILAATDLSAPARHAVDRAFLIASATDAELSLLHVVNQGALEGLRRLFGAASETVEQRLMDEARTSLTELAAGSHATAGVSASLRLCTGRVLSVILNEADALDAGLLVVGARGEDYLGRLLLGTTAERLLRRTLRPVLVVKQMPRAPYRRALVPVDFSPWSVRALRLARVVAPDAELVLFNAFEAPFESKLRFAGLEEETLNRYLIAARHEAIARLHALAAELGPSPGPLRFEVRHGDASRAILAMEQEGDCDLIVIGKHGQGVLEELLLGSVTKHVLAESSGDILVACERNDEVDG